MIGLSCFSASAQYPDVTQAQALFSESCEKAKESKINPYQGTDTKHRFYQDPDKSNRIFSLDHAVRKRKEFFNSSNDPVAREIQVFTQVARMQDEMIDRRRNASYVDQKQMVEDLADKECFDSYLRFLQAIDLPSMELTQKELAKESSAIISAQNRDKEAARRASKAVEAENLRRQKEAEVAAAEHAEKILAEERALKEAIKREAQKLPACSADVTIQAFRDMLEARRINIDDISKAGDDPRSPIGGTVEDPARVCRAQVANHKKSNEYKFRVRWRDTNHTKLLITIDN